jgi:hypothetical protein
VLQLLLFDGGVEATGRQVQLWHSARRESIVMRRNSGHSFSLVALVGRRIRRHHTGMP